MGPATPARDTVRHAAGRCHARAVDHGTAALLGLFSFSYIVLHFANWLVLDRWLDGSAIIADIAKRPYITVGFLRPW